MSSPSAASEPAATASASTSASASAATSESASPSSSAARPAAPQTASGALSASDCAQALGDLRAHAPLVQCLTNIVVAQWTANVLLAVGAAPAMVDNPHESADFAAIAGGVLVNLGTPYDDTASAMRDAVRSAATRGTPWVLDPVAAGALGWRTSLAHELLALGHPAVLRGNASEVLAMAGGTGGKGVDSTDTTDAAEKAARRLAGEHRTVVAVSGAVDLLTDGERLLRVDNGHAWLTRVTGVGCALGALMAAFAAVCDDALLAATAATATLTVAAERAAVQANGPGSFAVALLDALDAITPEELSELAKVG